MWNYLDITLGLVAITLLYGLSKRLKSAKLPLPPSPKGAPLIGNLLQVPTKFEWIQFHEWCKDYNTDILYLNIAGRELIVLDTSKVATDLLESQSSLYSGRPHLPMIIDLMGCDWHIGVLTYGTRWRKYQRLMHHSFHPVAVKQYRAQIIKATRNLLQRLLDDPDPLNILSHIQHMAGDTILSIAYGLDIQEENDPHLKRAQAVFHALGTAGIPGAFLVDAVPILKYVPAWFPGASFQRKAREWRKLIQETLELPYAEVKRNISGKRKTYGAADEKR